MLEKDFEYIHQLIEKARKSAYQSVNKELIQLYWKVGEYVSNRVKEADWGKNTVQQLANYIQAKQPATKGFSRRSLFRMKQFYETYKEVEKVSTLLTQISWSAHLDVEYAMSRNISPALIADYSTKLIDKEVLRMKLRELFDWQEKLEDNSKEDKA